MIFDQREQLDRDGFVIIENAIDDDTVAILRAAIDGASESGAIKRRGSAYAMRNLIEAVPAVRGLADSQPVRNILAKFMDRHPFVVRAILFDKIPDANWYVGWHQDRAIAVAERCDVAGFGPWSVKAGVPHVEPPLPVLESMVTVRVHLDDCDQTNGPLRVLAGSHRRGCLEAEQIKAMVKAGREDVCTVPVGGAVVMRPLILHASSPSERPSRRRVLHLEFADQPLPSPLQWRANR
jgi:ectoine hydroxylase-related dioxygenase (phytanoyl-CoA dioxygenase family)